jgi:antitoxin VapB
MNEETVAVLNNEGVQAIQIPGNFKINDDKVYLKKIGEIIYIIPFHSPWKDFYESLETFTPDFMEDREQETEEKRESLD